MGVRGVRVRRAAWLLAALLGLALPHAADAQIWVYRDEYGRTYFTDSPQHEGYEAYKPKGTVRHRAGVKPRLYAREFDKAIQRASVQHGVSAALVKAIIAAESGFDPQAISDKGARGLMQLMPDTAESLGVDDALDPWQNIDGGTRYLCAMIDRFPGEIELALAAYNAGPTKVAQFQGVPPYKETRSYVKRVLSYYKRYHADFR